MSKLQNPRCPATHLLAAHVLPGEGVGGGGGGPQAGEDQQRDDHGAGHGSLYLSLSRRRSLWSAADTKHADLATTVSHLAAASLLIYLKLKYCETGLCFDSIHDKM